MFKQLMNRLLMCKLHINRLHICTLLTSRLLMCNRIINSLSVCKLLTQFTYKSLVNSYTLCKHQINV